MEEKKVFELNIDDILPNRFQPRIKFDENSINELAGSIKEHGVIQPIIVREIGDKYEIIAGERRYKASVLAGKETIPAIVNNLNDRDSAEVALIENIQRKDLTPIEEAISYKKILDMGYLNQESLASKLERNQSTISNKLRLLNLDEEVQDALLNNKISERHARSLLRIDNKSQQIELLNKIISERLTVRKTDQEVDKLLKGEDLSVVTDEEENRNEEILMDNEQENETFNIPSSPIIEEIEIFDEVDKENNFSNEPINNEFSIEETTDFKPGFLDIDKIEQNAEEINVEKSPVDLNSLLKVDEQIINNKQEKIVEDNKEPDVVHGKFFSFTNEKEEQPIETQINDFNFDITTPTETQAEKIEENSQNIFSESLNSETSEIIETDLPEQTIPSFIEPDYNFNFDDITSNDNSDNDINIDNNQNVENKFTLDSSPLNNFNDDFKVDYSIPGVDEIDVNNDKNVELRDIVNEIRDYSKKIENYGYIVDLDELDFGDSYQITFKINKQ